MTKRKRGRKNQQGRFVWPVVVVVVIGDASPTNLIRTDTSECARCAVPKSVEEERAFNEEGRNGQRGKVK